MSAAVGLPVLGAAVALGWQAAAAAAAAAALAAGWEIAGLARGEAPSGHKSAPPLPPLARFALPLLPLLPLAIVAIGIGFAWDVPALSGAAAVAAAALAIASLPRRPAGASLRFLAVAAALYVGAMLAFAAPTSALQPDGRLWLAFALLVTFAVDTAAYFTGTAFGRRKLAPAISPGKTWEGTFGGLAAGVAAGAILPLLLPVVLGPLTSAADDTFALVPATGAALGLVMAIAAVLGDLSESWLKRRAGVKDAGGLIPGHGGFLDRLDSLSPNLAIVYLAASWASA